MASAEWVYDLSQHSLRIMSTIFTIISVAVLVDKDNDPKWSPPTLAEMTNEIVDRHFQPPNDGDLIV